MVIDPLLDFARQDFVRVGTLEIIGLCYALLFLRYQASMDKDKLKERKSTK